MQSQQCLHYMEGVCPAKSRVVPPHGSRGAVLVVVGEAPGETENLRGIPFCGDSGSELDGLYLPAAGLSRADALVTNAVWCLPDPRSGAKHPAPELVRHCSSRNLLPLLRSLPAGRVIVALGRISSALLAEEFGVSEPEPGVAVAAGRHRLLAAPHPAAAMRDENRTSAIMDEILRSFAAAGRILRGQPQPQPPRYEVHQAESLDEALEILGPEPQAAMDTETTTFGGGIWCISLAAGDDPIRAVVLRADGLDWPRLVRWLCSRQIILHHAIYDCAAVGREAGSWAEDALLAAADDTMLLAYEIRNLPLGLKPLARLLCGMEMQSYEEALLPEFRRVLEEELLAAAAALRDAPGPPQCRMVGRLWASGESAPLPDGLLRLAGETAAEHRRRIKALPDGELEPLAGREFLLPDDARLRRAAETVAEELDFRFSAAGAAVLAGRVSAAVRCSRSLRDLEEALAEVRRSSLLRPRLPESAHELIRRADPSVVAAYAAQDAAATLAVWRVLSSIASAGVMMVAEAEA